MSSKINEEALKTLKQTYPKEWQESMSDEELFLKLVRFREKEKKLKQELKAKSEKERKREARALIIFAKTMLKKMPQKEIINFIKKYYDEFQQKDNREIVDYTIYIKRLIGYTDDKNTDNNNTENIDGEKIEIDEI